MESNRTHWTNVSCSRVLCVLFGSCARDASGATKQILSLNFPQQKITVDKFWSIPSLLSFSLFWCIWTFVELMIEWVKTQKLTLYLFQYYFVDPSMPICIMDNDVKRPFSSSEEMKVNAKPRVLCCGAAEWLWENHGAPPDFHCIKMTNDLKHFLLTLNVFGQCRRTLGNCNLWSGTTCVRSDKSVIFNIWIL